MQLIEASDSPTSDFPTSGGPAVPEAIPPAKPAKPQRGIFIGIIAGGSALILLAIVAVVAFVLPAILGSFSGNNQLDILDIAEEPETSWKYDWVGGDDETFLESSPTITAVGNDMAIIWSSFDSYAFSESQVNSQGWYEGYESDYEDGFAAGEQYNIDYQKYWEDYSYTVEYPNQDDYFPVGAYDDYDKFRGFHDGWDDGYYEEGYGDSMKVEPIEPDYRPRITLLNTASGDEQWTVDLSDEVDGVDYSSSFYAFDVPSTDAIVVIANNYADDEYSTSIATLGKSGGEVISQVDYEGDVSVDVVDGDLIIVVDENADHSTIGRYSVDGLDDDPKWEVEQDIVYSVNALGDFLMLQGDDEGVILQSSDGEEADWGDDIDSDVYYSLLGTQLLRWESDEDENSMTVEGWSFGDDATWEDPVEADYVSVIDGALFTFDNDELQRLDPSTGEEMWEDAYDEEISNALGIAGNNLILYGDEEVIHLDLGSGEELFVQKIGSYYSEFYEGANAYYVLADGELSAYSYRERGDLWSFDLEEDEGLAVLGKHLGLINFSKGTVHGLSPK